MCQACGTGNACGPTFKQCARSTTRHHQPLCFLLDNRPTSFEERLGASMPEAGRARPRNANNRCLSMRQRAEARTPTSRMRHSPTSQLWIVVFEKITLQCDVNSHTSWSLQSKSQKTHQRAFDCRTFRGLLLRSRNHKLTPIGPRRTHRRAPRCPRRGLNHASNLSTRLLIPPATTSFRTIRV